MKLIIDIPEETYKGIMLGKWDKNGLAYYVKVGTPLPKEKEQGMIIIDDDGIMHKVLPMDTLDKISIQERSDVVV